MDYQVDAGIITEIYKNDYETNFNKEYYGENYPGNAKSTTDRINHYVSFNIGPGYDYKSGSYAVTRIYNYMFRLKYTF